MKFCIIVGAVVLAGCVTIPPPRPPIISEARLRATMAVLASDSFEGRMAGTAGEAKTIAYLAERFRAAGLTNGARGPVPFLDPFAIVARPVKPGLPGPAVRSAQDQLLGCIEILVRLLAREEQE